MAVNNPAVSIDLYRKAGIALVAALVGTFRAERFPTRARLKHNTYQL
jgi:hypothetical protein